MAQQWRPVSGEGDITDSIRYQANGEIIGVRVEDDYYCHEELPDNYRVCRLVEAPDALTVVMTEESTLELIRLGRMVVEAFLDVQEEKSTEAETAAWILGKMLDELEAKLKGATE